MDNAGDSSASLYPEHGYLVTLSEREVTCRHPDGLVEAVPWDELRAVLLETNDQGPFAMDVFWILIGQRGGCVIPQGAQGESALLERLQALDGFDNDMVIQAMMSTENQRFLCWQREPS